MLLIRFNFPNVDLGLKYCLLAINLKRTRLLLKTITQFWSFFHLPNKELCLSPICIRWQQKGIATTPACLKHIWSRGAGLGVTDVAKIKVGWTVIMSLKVLSRALGSAWLERGCANHDACNGGHSSLLCPTASNGRCLSDGATVSYTESSYNDTLIM